MNWQDKIRQIDLNQAREIASRHGHYALISKALDIPIYRLKELRYRNYIIKNKEHRELAINFSLAIEEGIFEYRKREIEKNRF